MGTMVLRARLTPQVAATRKAVRQLISDLTPGTTILVAVSGGADSLALASAANFEGRKLKLNVAAVIIDHGLQLGSDKVAKKAKSRCESLGIEQVVIEKVTVRQSGDGLEAQARESRYKGIEKVRSKLGASWVLVGHNLNDQAETVLLGLARGSGLRSIAAMVKVDPDRKLMRPFLDISSADLRKACKDQGIEYWNDPHNSDDRFLRVKVRKLAENLEKTLGPGFAAALARTAEIARESDEALSLLAKELAVKARAKSTASKAQFDIEPLRLAPAALRRKAIHQICLDAGAKNLSRAQVLQIEQLITAWKGQKSSVISGITVERVANQLVVTSRRNPGATCS
ncbi:MAG: tRNA lysidine(34) synthetase TilS [Aquiluna sp.]